MHKELEMFSIVVDTVVKITKFGEGENILYGMRCTRATWYRASSILTLWQKVVGQRAHMCMYIFMNVCTCSRPRARLWYGAMQRLQVLDSRESTNEHKTCQQPWEDGRVSTELLVRPVFTLYRGSRCGSQGAQTIYQTDRSTRIHFC